MTNAGEEWLHSSEAVKALIDLYSDCRDGDRKRAETDAMATLLARLRFGRARARAASWYVKSRWVIRQEDASAPKKERKREAGSDKNGNEINTLFWAFFDYASRPKDLSVAQESIEVLFSNGDLIIGEIDTGVLIKWKAGSSEYATASIYAFDVEFEANSIGLRRGRGGGPDSGTLSTPKLQKRKSRLPETALQLWWGQQGESVRAVPIDVLWRLCGDAFPEHSIARERIRALDPGRKPGPKPMSDKATA